MGSSSKIFSGVLWSVITNVVNAAYGFILIPILINYFGKAEYGLIGLAQSVNAYIQLMDMGLTSTNVRFFSNWISKGDYNRVNKLFSTCTAFYGIIGIFNALILLIIYFVSDVLFNVTYEQNIILQHLLLILAIAAIINWLTSCYNQIIQATENVAWTQKRLLYTKLLMVIVLIITILLKLNIETYFLLTILCNWLILPWVVKKIKEVANYVSFVPKFSLNTFKEILPYTLNIFSFSIFSFSFQNLRVVFIGVQGQIESVTDLRIIMGIVGICSSVCGIFLQVLLPSSSKVIANSDKEGYYKIAYKGTKYIMLFITFCVFGMISISKDLLLLYVGTDYLYLLPWLILYLVTLLGNHILGISSLILAGTDISALTKITAVSSSLGLLFAWYLIPFYEVGGVVISIIIYNILQMFFYYTYYWKKVMNIDSYYIFTRITLPIALYGSIIALVIYCIPHFDNSWINVALFGLSFATFYGIISYLYLSPDDRAYLYGLIKNNSYAKNNDKFLS